MQKLQTLLISRKFWAALIGLALIVIKAYRPDFPITGDQMTGIVVILVGYIMGTAIQDSSLPKPPWRFSHRNPSPRWLANYW